MTISTLKIWGRFYGSMLVVNVVNGTLIFLVVFLGGGGAQMVGKVDFRTISWAGFGWTWLGTVLLYVVVRLGAHLLPEPKEPTEP